MGLMGEWGQQDNQDEMETLDRKETTGTLEGGELLEQLVWQCYLLIVNFGSCSELA